MYPDPWWIFWLFVLAIMLLVLGMLLAATACPDLARCAFPSASQPGRSGRLRALPCRLARLAYFPLSRLSPGNRRPTASRSAACIRPSWLSQKLRACAATRSTMGRTSVCCTGIPPPAKFDHAKAGFVLDGKHVGLACAKCHNAANIGSTGTRGVTDEGRQPNLLGPVSQLRHLP